VNRSDTVNLRLERSGGYFFDNLVVDNGFVGQVLPTFRRCGYAAYSLRLRTWNLFSSPRTRTAGNGSLACKGTPLAVLPPVEALSYVGTKGRIHSVKWPLHRDRWPIRGESGKLSTRLRCRRQRCRLALCATNFQPLDAELRGLRAPVMKAPI